jgi:hypothetical protein
MSFGLGPTGLLHRAWQLALPMLGLVVAAGTVWLPAQAADLERPPINYGTAPVSNPVARLQQRLDAGKASLVFDQNFGYLPSLLRALEVPVSSQVLVFSKTSMQRNRISPRLPRALYFRDDVYIGFCQHGQVLEVSAADPGLGTVFYTLEQAPTAKPRFQRQNDSCLICHASSQNQGYPGQLLRSVYVDGQGYPILSSGSFRIDQTSPLKQRWGGWYVTGTSGAQAHLGNLIVRDESTPPERIDNSTGLNVTNLRPYCRTSDYLSKHSDIVALLVLEHQAEMHNRIVRAGLLTRLALYEQDDLNKALGRPADERSDLTTRRIQSACEPLVKYLLFSGEALLTAPIRGTSGFAEEFTRRGPLDSRHRSLRDLDLRTRLFTYPCSYLIYGETFDALPAEARDHVLRRVWEVLTGEDTSADFAHLAVAERRAILEILRETKPSLPAYWRELPAASAP